MNFAPVLPPIQYPRLDNGTYHLVQAHVLEDMNDQGVWTWFSTRDCESNHTTILDCGTAELGEPTPDVLFRVAERIRPSIIVCPDAFLDSEKTIQYWGGYQRNCLVRAPKMMIVPHGRSIADWCGCADYILSSTKCTSMEDYLRTVVGIPKVLDSDEVSGGTRFEALCFMAEYYPDIPIHLLGIWNHPIEILPLMFNKLRLKIVGIDSTLPYAHALGAVTTTLWQYKMGLDHNDFMLKEGGICPSTQTLAKLNIAIMRRYLELAARNVPFETVLSYQDVVQGHQMQMEMTEKLLGLEPSVWEKLRELQRQVRDDRLSASQASSCESSSTE